MDSTAEVGQTYKNTLQKVFHRKSHIFVWNNEALFATMKAAL